MLWLIGWSIAGIYVSLTACDVNKVNIVANIIIGILGLLLTKVMANEKV